MTNERDDIDKELKAYLEGKDGLSDTYRELGSTEPSNELDAHILQAARDELAQDTQQPAQAGGNSIYSRPYAIAASVLLGILIGVMIAPQPPETTSTAGVKTLSKAPATFQAEPVPPEPLNEREQETLETAVARATTINAEESLTDNRGDVEAITVASSRIADRSYRANPDTWLEEIRRLQQEADVTQTALNEERALFRENHPDIELPRPDNE